MDPKKRKITTSQEKIIFYGDNNEVNAVANYDFNDYLKLSSKKQKLTGFDNKYPDFVSYILQITHNIWEEKGIGVIYDTYANNIIMHFGAHNVIGIDKVIKGTLETLYSFPDRKLIGQNVIWSPDGEKGFFSSHRIISTATNLNDSSFGEATGQKVHFRTAVDCAVANNRIYEEWLVRDNLWIVKQLGQDPWLLAQERAKNKNEQLTEAQQIQTNMKGQYFPQIHQAQDDSIGEWVYEMMTTIYNARRFDKVKNYYMENAVVHSICDQDYTGFSAIQGMLINLWAAFPNAAFVVERITCNKQKEHKSYQVAIRWIIDGLHEGRGMFGSPTNAPVKFLGITHLVVNDYKITQEWITFDGLDIMSQIARASHQESKLPIINEESENEIDQN